MVFIFCCIIFFVGLTMTSLLKKFLWPSRFADKKIEDSMVESHASPSNLTQEKYDVFLSFRGKDTRDNITSHVHKALRGEIIKVYIDENQETGVEISQALKEAIEGSRLAVIIFSANYADSSWCLNELLHILKCKKLVVPVFYHVKPSDVREQKGDFGNALRRIKSRHTKDVLKKWKLALTEAANLAGCELAAFRDEAELVTNIVGAVKSKLLGQPSVDFTRLVGYPKRLEAAELEVEIGSPENGSPEIGSPGVRIIGIGGMCGIGKTTLAKVMYDKISYQFDACCILYDVRDQWKHGAGTWYLQNKLMRKLFHRENLRADDTYRKFDDRLKRMKVLIVLDDINDSRQLNDITRGVDKYKCGSIIILTSSDDRALDGSDVLHKVVALSEDEAIKLFQLKAFENRTLTEDEIRWSTNAVLKYSKTDFNPMALISLASAVRGRSFDSWKEILQNYTNCPDGDVHKLLKQSCKSLIKKENKCMFLDIACFFNGESRDFAERIFDGSGYPVKEGINDLVKNSILRIVEEEKKEKLRMPHLFEEMGREIVIAESEDPGSRSRLWNHEDLHQVFRNNTQTNKIQGISLDMSSIDEVIVSSDFFSTTYKLRLLKFHNHFGKSTVLPGGEGELQSLPERLRYLYWDGYPFPSFPEEFIGQYLVELKMQYSKAERLWDRPQNLKHLRVIDLSFSELLIEIPNLSKAVKVESVCLRGCKKLREVPQYFENLKKLNSLNLKDCSSLETVSALPSNVVVVNLKRCERLTSLPTNIRLESLNLQLAGCSSLEYNPEILALL